MLSCAPDTLVATCCQIKNIQYRKCPKILHTKVADKMAYANSADPDQTAPSGVVWSGSKLFAIPLSIQRYNCINSKIYVKTVWN